MHIIIIGCGDLGARLAQDLSLGKDNIVIIDTSRNALKKLGMHFNGRTLRGDGLDPKILEEAGVNSCDLVFVLTGNEDLNIVIAEAVQKMYKVNKVVIQINSLFKEDLVAKKGIITVNRTNLFLEQFKKCI